MKIAVSNSGPLIHLAKVGLLDFLFKLYDKIIIPNLVFEEVVEKGKEKGYSDALLIEQAISKKKIEIKRVQIIQQELLSTKLHLGELYAVQIALNLKINPILLDDEEARIYARNLNLRVKSTLGLLIDFYNKNLLNLEESLTYLRKLNSLMYLSSDVYQLVEDILKGENKG
ncbi:MAG: DUF3368 domain-containing protein [Promethearchaeota archaeon]